MKTLPAVSSLIGSIYESILQPAAWSPVLEQVCETLDAKAASVHVFNPVEGRASIFVEHGTDPIWTAKLLSQYAAMTPIGAALLIADLDQPVGAFDYIDEAEFVESQFYREWCAPQGYHDMLGAIIAKRPTEVGAISATRAVEKGHFGAADRKFIGLIAPHVRRAVTISGLLEQRTIERDAFASLMEQFAAAVFLIDKTGRLLRLNQAGQALLSAASPVELRDGTISLTESSANEALSAALVSNPVTAHLISALARDGIKYLAGLLLIDAKLGWHALIVNQQETDIPAVGQALAQLFNLTPREVCLLMPLLEGKTIEEIAGTLGISMATARSHLVRLFAKTGTSRQAELVQLVLKAIPPLRL